jgi:hypothetical protein
MSDRVRTTFLAVDITRHSDETSEWLELQLLTKPPSRPQSLQGIKKGDKLAVGRDATSSIYVHEGEPHFLPWRVTSLFKTKAVNSCCQLPFRYARVARYWSPLRHSLARGLSESGPGSHTFPPSLEMSLFNTKGG